MAIAFRSLTSLAYASRTNTTLTAPAGLADGDILIALIITAKATTAPTPTPPAGFTSFGAVTSVTDAGSFNGRMHVFWKRAAAESGSYTFTHAVASSQGILAAYSGALASGTPLGATSNATGNDNISTGTTITTTAANSYLLYGAHNWTGTARAAPSGMTERFDNLGYLADQLIATASATGTRVQNPNGNGGSGDQWAVRMVELLAAVAASDATTLKAWTGSAWTQEMTRVWSGSAWIIRPVKRWTGSAWV